MEPTSSRRDGRIASSKRDQILSDEKLNPRRSLTSCLVLFILHESLHSFTAEKSLVCFFMKSWINSRSFFFLVSSRALKSAVAPSPSTNSRHASTENINTAQIDYMCRAQDIVSYSSFFFINIQHSTFTKRSIFRKQSQLNLLESLRVILPLLLLILFVFVPFRQKLLAF